MTNFLLTKRGRNMEKKYNISLILIALGICMFTSSFFVFSIDKVNDIYITQAKNDITHLKNRFLKIQ